MKGMVIMEILKVSSKSNPSKVAGAIANIYRENKEVEIQTIGAGSLNQAIKAIAICRGFVAPTGDNLVVIPAFNDIIINGEQKTANLLLQTNNGPIIRYFIFKDIINGSNNSSIPCIKKKYPKTNTCISFS